MKVLLVIHERSINHKTGLRELVTGLPVNWEYVGLIIEATVKNGDFVPTDPRIQAIFPTINRDFVKKTIVVY